jgi:site-specific recombinase XerD
MEDSMDVASFEKILDQREQEALDKSLAENTRRAYESDWRDFSSWCAALGAEPLPASVTTLKRYFIDRSSSLSKATLTRRIASISRSHRENGHVSPTIDPGFRRVMSGLRKMNPVPQAAKNALLDEDLIEILEQVDDDTPQGKRDRALLLIGFTAALRRSELVALDRDDICITREGVALTLRHSKTDQEGEGVKIGIPRGNKPATCAVTQLAAWLATLNIESGPVFRRILKNGVILPKRLTDHAVAVIVKRYVGHAGFSKEHFSGHSLRAGLATSAALAGKSERQIMQQTRHKSERMVRVYIRNGSLFKDNVVHGLKL